MLHTIGTVIDYDAQAFKRFYVYAEMNCWVKYVTMWSFLGGSFMMATNHNACGCMLTCV